VQLGRNSGGLTDTDLDCAEAITVAPYLLPQTNSLFGRKTARCAHRLYVSDLHENHEVAEYKFTDPCAKANGFKATLVELRIGGGDKGAQSVSRLQFTGTPTRRLLGRRTASLPRSMARTFYAP
jgi:hypothetical protein